MSQAWSTRGCGAEPGLGLRAQGVVAPRSLQVEPLVSFPPSRRNSQNQFRKRRAPRELNSESPGGVISKARAPQAPHPLTGCGAEAAAKHPARCPPESRPHPRPWWGGLLGGAWERYLGPGPPRRGPRRLGSGQGKPGPRARVSGSGAQQRIHLKLSELMRMLSGGMTWGALPCDGRRGSWGFTPAPRPALSPQPAGPCHLPSCPSLLGLSS